MKTTNLLLGVIIFLLLLNLVCLNNWNILPRVNAQTSSIPPTPKNQILNVRIVGVDENVIVRIANPPAVAGFNNPLGVFVINGVINDDRRFDRPIPVFQVNK